jgi:phosphopantothenate synthetase
MKTIEHRAGICCHGRGSAFDDLDLVLGPLRVIDHTPVERTSRHAEAETR